MAHLSAGKVNFSLMRELARKVLIILILICLHLSKHVVISYFI